MSRDLNRWEGIGRLSKDVELKQLPGGSSVANIGIACGDDYKDKNTGQKVEKTNWIDAVVFGAKAENLAKYAGKGSRLYFSGKLEKRKWQDAEGKDRYSTEVKVEDYQFLDVKGATQQQAPQHSTVNNPPQHQPQGVHHAGINQDDGYDEFTDDIPF